ncbi:Nadh dehydrogenase [Globisporangium polare]
MSWRAQISRSIQELRFVACETSQSSQGLRTFFRKNYEELKMLNPRTPFVYREAEEMEPFVYARFDWGVEKQVFVQNKSDKEILDIVKGLVEHGFTLPKSPESDIVVATPIIEAEKGEDAYDPINLTWDGVTLRRNPDFDIPLEEASKIDVQA